jgi:RND family efflux transporter MFP subunit
MTKHNEDAQASMEQPIYNRKVPWITHTIVSVVILAVAIGIVMSLFGSKPEANRWGQRPPPSVAVETRSLSTESYEVWVDSYGTVEAQTTSNLVSEVNGRVVAVSENIRAGGRFSKGDMLVKLDERDFRVEIDVATSAAAEAELAYLQEVAQAEFAAQEWNEPPESEAARKLALREPQVAAAKAALQAAKSRLERAKLDLQRTTIVAPFDGMVLTQSIDVGQVVSPSQPIAQIYSTDIVEVRLPIKINDLEHLVLPEGEQQLAGGAAAVLESEIGTKTFQWQAEIVRTEGAFDPATRMLYVVAHVKDPFISNSDRPAIRIGQFVRAKVAGNRYEDVFVIPRRAVSQDFMVSIAQDGVLQKRSIAPLWTDAKSVVIASNSLENTYANGAINSENPALTPLTTQDKIILTPTANLPDGTRVRPLNGGNQRGSEGRPRAIAADQSDSRSKPSSGGQTASAGSAE